MRHRRKVVKVVYLHDHKSIQTWSDLPVTVIEAVHRRLCVLLRRVDLQHADFLLIMTSNDAPKMAIILTHTVGAIAIACAATTHVP